MTNNLRKPKRLADYSTHEHTYNQGYLQALIDNNLMVLDNIYDWFHTVYMNTDIYKGLTHKFLESPVERVAKAEIMPYLFNAT